ncbi:hypothetical protein [Alsobacter soli]|uniref:hypothetical protein n=1 Tax=Alsobacter soli TaxID=2109933 RepID=UPI0011B20D57|nr:hypothetical protein [Alsobacter soli]
MAAAIQSVDLAVLGRMGLIYFHLLAALAAAGAITAGDMAILGHAHLDLKLLGHAARCTTIALVVLWMTGLSVILIDTHADLALIAGSGKLLAKLSVASVLTLNGVALHRVGFPALGRAHANPRRAAVLPCLLGAVSLSSWMFAAFLGIAKPIAPVMGFGGFAALYACAIVGGGAAALAFIRPRLAEKLDRPDSPGREPRRGLEGPADMNLREAA